MDSIKKFIFKNPFRTNKTNLQTTYQKEEKQLMENLVIKMLLIYVIIISVCNKTGFILQYYACTTFPFFSIKVFAILANMQKEISILYPVATIPIIPTEPISQKVLLFVKPICQFIIADIIKKKIL